MVGSALYRLGVVPRGGVDSYLAWKPVVVGQRLGVCAASRRTPWSADVGGPTARRKLTATEDETCGAGIETQTMPRVLGKLAILADNHDCEVPVLWRGTRNQHQPPRSDRNGGGGFSLGGPSTHRGEPWYFAAHVCLLRLSRVTASRLAGYNDSPS
jgi:hypothetical protein